MFEVIDDLNPDIWKDIGPPPDNFEEIENFKEYIDLFIVHRTVKNDPAIHGIQYVVADINGKNDKHVVLKGIKNLKVDPLKAMKHFHAILKQIDAPEDNRWEVQTLLLDLDWCQLK